MKWFAVVVLALSAGCSIHLPKVDVEARDADLAALDGEWSGMYETTSGTRRGGSILFRIDADSHKASGDVLMTVYARNMAGPPKEAVWPAPAPTSAQLRITFVRASGNVITGKLERYPDPDCSCTLETTFRGRLRGDVIEGTFTSVHLDAHATTGGTWKVYRQKK